MASEKVVNYTAEQTEQVVSMYNAGEAVEKIAEAVGKTARSVIAKLSREGVYKAKSAEKAGKGATKADLVTELEKMFDMAPGALETLTKASHPALELLVKAVR